VLAITTFHPDTFKAFARDCVLRMSQLWPGPIRVYFESSAPPALDGTGVECRPLNSPERSAFLAREIPDRRGFLWDAKRFCHKVFAQLDAAAEGEPFWWIDADVAIFRRVPEELLEQHELVTFLGRDTYTETGLVGFNPKHPEFAEFISRYRSMYTDGKILDLPGWTDCHAFDAARQGMGRDLTPDGKGFDNVMVESPFGPYMAHYKGPLKLELYRLGGANAVNG